MLPSQPVGGAQARMELSLVRGSGALRTIQIAVGLPVLFMGGLDLFDTAWLVVATYLTAVAWSIALYACALRRGRFTTVWIVLDVVVAVLWLLAMPQTCVSACATSWPVWVVPPAIGSAIAAALFGPVWLAITGPIFVVAAYLGGIWRSLGTSSDVPGTTTVNAYFILGFALVAWVFAGLLRKGARQVDLATAEAIEARAREAAAQARYDERTRQYDVLHQTVLTTLSKIARGGLDHRTEEVQSLCARDADFLRGLVTGAHEEGPTDFLTTLAGVARDKQALGLRVHSQFHALPASVPARVSVMLIGAAREALTNVAKHAGTDEAWLTAVGDADGVRVVVVDRWVGFDPSRTSPGRGLMRDLRHAVIETGGIATVTSSPGEGTVVEVSWTP